MGVISERLSPNEYKYYDSPEGEDCFKKVWYMTKYAGIYSVLGATLDVLLYSHPKGYAQTMARYAYITLPAMGVAASFAATTCTLTSLRKKDDKVNYLVGGLASGAVVGAWKKSIKVGVFASIALAAFAVLKKDSIDNNWSMLGDPAPQKYSNLLYLKRDYTIVSDPGKSWK